MVPQIGNHSASGFWSDRHRPNSSLKVEQRKPDVQSLTNIKITFSVKSIIPNRQKPGRIEQNGGFLRNCLGPRRKNRLWQGITNRIDGEEPVILQVVEAMKKAGYHFDYRILNPG